VKPKSVLITGATTPLGARVCAELTRLGVAVLATGIEPDAEARRLFSSAVNYRRVDLAKSRDVRDLLLDAVVSDDIDAVVHTGFHRKLEGEDARIHSRNVESLRLLIALCEAQPTVRRLVVRSSADVYRVDHALPCMVGEHHPLSFAANAPQWLRNRVEADMLACSRMGMSALEIVVLRCAEIVEPDMGSQLYDYLNSRVCLRPMGFDPMVNVLALEDATDAFVNVIMQEQCQGVFNIPGAATLPLSALIRSRQRLDVPVPGPLLGPLYALRKTVTGTDFSYAMSGERLHYPAILDGAAAARMLGYKPVVRSI